MTEKADYILSGGTVVTMNSAYDLFVEGAVAIRDDVIVAVGTAEEIIARFEAAETIDCSHLARL
jgi:5-methylthioadenosine/S-adenosylhomocysteine deaminase